MTYIHLSLTDSLTYSSIDPSKTYSTRRLRGIFYKKNNSKKQWILTKANTAKANFITQTKRIKRRPFISMHTAIKIYKGLIEPHFDYCSVVWDGLSQQLSEKLQKLQNRAARVITKSSYNTNSSYLLNSLSWDNLSVRRTKQKTNLMYKCVNHRP